MQIGFVLLNLKYKGLNLITATVSITLSNTFLKGKEVKKFSIKVYDVLVCAEQCKFLVTILWCTVTNKKDLWAADTKFCIHDFTSEQVPTIC